MLLRAIAPKNTVAKVLHECVPFMTKFESDQMASVIGLDVQQPTLTLYVPADHFDKVIRQTQATPSPLPPAEGYANKADVLFLSDHDGNHKFLGGGRLALFLMREELAA